MNNPLILLLARQNGQTLVETQEYLRSLGMTDEIIASVYGSDWQWLSLTLREPTYARQQAIRRACMVSDPETGAREDLTLLPQKRFAVMVESWSDARPVNEQTFIELPAVLANVINGLIEAWMYPNLANNADFIGAWRKLQASSAPENVSA